MSRRRPITKLPAPFLQRIVLRDDVIEGKSGYPYDLPWLDREGFELRFTTPVTILVGENGTGKSTLVEAIAALSGYDEAGGGKGYRPVDHARAIDQSGAGLADVFRASWLPKVTSGWFIKAETFFSVARYLDIAAEDSGNAPPDFLSWSHGEGFVRFFKERMSQQGIYFMDEPESALSPKRQLELLAILDRIQRTAISQVIVATHSPILMALPNASLLEITRHGITKTTLEATQHFKLYRAFTRSPIDFVTDAIQEMEASREDKSGNGTHRPFD